MYTLSDVFQSLWPMVDCIHCRHIGKKGLQRNEIFFKITVRNKNESSLHTIFNGNISLKDHKNKKRNEG